MKVFFCALIFLLTVNVRADIQLEGFIREGSILDVSSPRDLSGKYILKGDLARVRDYKDLYVSAQGKVEKCGKNKCLNISKLEPAIFDPLASKKTKKKSL